MHPLHLSGSGPGPSSNQPQATTGLPSSQAAPNSGGSGPKVSSESTGSPSTNGANGSQQNTGPPHSQPGYSGGPSVSTAGPTGPSGQPGHPSTSSYPPSSVHNGPGHQSGPTNGSGPSSSSANNQHSNSEPPGRPGYSQGKRDFDTHYMVPTPFIWIVSNSHVILSILFRTRWISA